MSLMTVSSESADVLTVLRYSRCSRRQVGVEGQLGHADDAVHGRADLVAHVGQELALGPVGGLGGVLGLAQFLLGPLASVMSTEMPTRCVGTPCSSSSGILRVCRMRRPQFGVDHFFRNVEQLLGPKHFAILGDEVVRFVRWKEIVVVLAEHIRALEYPPSSSKALLKRSKRRPAASLTKRAMGMLSIRESRKTRMRA